MDIRNFPINILVTIFNNFDFEYFPVLFRKLKLHPDDILYKVMETIQFSRVIVTNEWQNLLKLLPRAAQVRLLFELEQFMHVSLADFKLLSHLIQDHWDNRVPTQKIILFVIRCDNTVSASRYQILRDAVLVLAFMPKPVQNATKLLHLSIPDEQVALPGHLGIELSTMALASLMLVSELRISLESLRFQGAFSTGSDLVSRKLPRNFSSYEKMHSLHLSNLGIKSVEDISFPAKLKNLVLSQNAIDHIERANFPPTLIQLDLSCNMLKLLDGDHLPLGLKRLNLSKNYIEQIEDLPASIEYLDISFNEITSARFDIPLCLRFLRTDIAQFYLMSESTRKNLLRRKVSLNKVATRSLANLLI